LNGQNPIVTSLHYSDLFHGLLVNYTDGAFLGMEFTLPSLLLTPCVASSIVRSAYKISPLSFPHFCTLPKGSFFVNRLLGMKRENQQDATIRCLLLTSVSTCFGHHYAHLQENKAPVTAFGVLFWFCWMWLVAVVGRCLVGCEH